MVNMADGKPGIGQQDHFTDAARRPGMPKQRSQHRANLHPKEGEHRPSAQGVENRRWNKGREHEQAGQHPKAALREALRRSGKGLKKDGFRGGCHRGQV